MSGMFWLMLQKFFNYREFFFCFIQLAGNPSCILEGEGEKLGKYNKIMFLLQQDGFSQLKANL